SHWRRQLAPDGRMVATSFDMHHIAKSLATISASAVHGRGRIRFFRGSPEYGLLAELTRMADDGLLQPVVDEVFPLSQVAEAHPRLAAGAVHGKVVISLACAPQSGRATFGASSQPSRSLRALRPRTAGGVSARTARNGPLTCNAPRRATTSTTST